MTKASTLIEVIEVFGEKPIIFSKNANLVPFEKPYYFSRILQMKNIQPQNRTLPSNRTLSIGEKVKKMFNFSVSGG